ncbi:YidC/Oxa1 family membrane protein insertase [Mycolicibacterium sp. HS_4_1]
MQKQFGTDRQRLALEMQKLQHDHIFNPLMGCHPMFIQIPGFFGLYCVIHSCSRTVWRCGHDAQIRR